MDDEVKPLIVCTIQEPCQDCQKDQYRVALARIAGLPAFSPMDLAVRIAREALAK